jgi:hypothetical protein
VAEGGGLLILNTDEAVTLAISLSVAPRHGIFVTSELICLQSVANL